MALPATDPASRVTGLLDEAEPRFRAVFLDAVAGVSTVATLTELERLVEERRLEQALARASAMVSTRVATEAAETFVRAGIDGVRTLEDITGDIIGFDQVNQRAVDAMRQERLRLVAEFTLEQRFATRMALIDGVRRGLNPTAQARNFRASIGLTAKQQQAALNYRRLLQQGSLEALTRELRDKRFDRTVRRAARTGEPLTEAQVERMYARYRERSVRHRSTVIARTEALRAVNAGNSEAYDQAVDAGVLSRDQIVNTWNTAGGPRVRDSHRHLNRMQRLKGQTFPGFAGALRFPGDFLAPASETIMCRCALSTRIGLPNI